MFVFCMTKDVFKKEISTCPQSDQPHYSEDKSQYSFPIPNDLIKYVLQVAYLGTVDFSLVQENFIYKLLTKMHTK